ncbi:MAG: hypothetical protein ACXWNB_05010 [Candidatus Binataceae bacterium]
MSVRRLQPPEAGEIEGSGFTSPLAGKGGIGPSLRVLIPMEKNRAPHGFISQDAPSRV